MTLRARIAINSAKFHTVLAVALFASAGTLRFWQAWLYLALQLASTTAVNLYLLHRDPALLDRRLTVDEQGEKEPVQRVLIGILRVLGLATVVATGLDRRFGWSTVPAAAVVVASIVFLAGCAVVFVVFRENTFTSSIVEVADGQTVVATGPYRTLRHPMYAGVLLMGLATPIVLGSYWAELAQPVAIVLLIVRILAEEKVLTERLQGYREYMARTTRRLVPGIW